MSLSNPRTKGAVVLVAVLFALSGCGLGDEAEGGDGSGGLSAGDWVNRADAVCNDGTQEASALPAVATPEDVSRDAEARAEILSMVRDGVVALGRPDEVDENLLNAYIAELDSDIEVMEVAAEAVLTGEDYAQLDGTAGVAATEIGLAECLAFSDLIGQ